MTSGLSSFARDRRSFLRAVGAGALGLPFFRLLERSAIGQVDGGPRRFVGVYCPHGMAHPLWTMRETDTETEFDLRFPDCPLAPFDDAATYGKSFKDKLLLIDGVDLTVGVNGGVTGHDAGSVILTGAARPASSSLDQFLAVEQGLGTETLFTSLTIGVDVEWAIWSLSVGPTGAPIAPITDPKQLYDLVFANLVVGDDSQAQAEFERRRRRGQSVIDFIKAELDTLKPKLHTREQEKLDAHLTSVRELERRLEGFTDTGPSCTKPDAPSVTLYRHWESSQYAGPEDEYFGGLADLQVDLLAQALACDLTRFATLYLQHRLKGDHHSVVHAYSNRVGVYDPATFAPLAEANAWNYRQVARLLQRLDEHSILDDTIVFASSDVGDPSEHNSRYVPVLLAGGAGGKWRMGRRLRVGAPCEQSAQACFTTERVPHNRLLVSICNAFGVEVDSFGYSAESPDATRGELDGLT
jgi:hypothetical protein